MTILFLGKWMDSCPESIVLRFSLATMLCPKGPFADIMSSGCRQNAQAGPVWFWPPLPLPGQRNRSHGLAGNLSAGRKPSAVGRLPHYFGWIVKSDLSQDGWLHRKHWLCFWAAGHWPVHLHTGTSNPPPPPPARHFFKTISREEENKSPWIIIPLYQVRTSWLLNSLLIPRFENQSQNSVDIYFTSTTLCQKYRPHIQGSHIYKMPSRDWWGKINVFQCVSDSKTYVCCELPARAACLQSGIRRDGQAYFLNAMPWPVPMKVSKQDDWLLGLQRRGWRPWHWAKLGWKEVSRSACLPIAPSLPSTWVRLFPASFPNSVEEAFWKSKGVVFTVSGLLHIELSSYM